MGYICFAKLTFLFVLVKQYGKKKLGYLTAAQPDNY